jgi:outer membrane protein TolC
MNIPLKHLYIHAVLIFTALMTLSVCGTAWTQERSIDAIEMEKLDVLDLQTAARIALKENPSLAAARARVDQAHQAVRKERSSYWPQFDLTASWEQDNLSDNDHQSQLTTSQALFGPGGSITDPEDYYRVSLTASWLLFDGFTRRFNLAAAKYGEQSSTVARDDARRLLLQAVSSAFLSAQLSLENVAIAQADEAFNQRQLTEARFRRHEVGTGALSDVLNFEIRVNSAQSDLLVAERTFETARIGLAALLGIDNARLPNHTQLDTLDETTETELRAPQIGPLLENVYAQRPDVLQNDWAVRQAEANVKARRGSYYPTLSLNASCDSERTGDFGFESEDIGSSIGISLSYNLFNGGLFQARHQEAKMRLREVQHNLHNLKINVASEVQTISKRILSAQKQLLLQRTNAHLVRKNRNLLEKEYKAGVGSLVRLNEAQRDLTIAQVRLATVQVALRQAWYDLWSATGQIEDKLIP